MKPYVRLVLLIASMLGLSIARAADVIKDPVADFLKLPIKDRCSPASSIVSIHEVRTDVDGDGVDEVFIGHNKMWNGGNEIYYSAYAESAGGYARLLPADQDIAINFHAGSRKATFVGFISEVGTQGLMVVEAVLRHKPGDPGQLTPSESFSSRNVYTIHKGRLLVRQLGSLDLQSIEGQEFLARYFAKGVLSRPVTAKTYSVGKLKELGYTFPQWSDPIYLNSANAGIHRGQQRALNMPVLDRPTTPPGDSGPSTKSLVAPQTDDPNRTNWLWLGLLAGIVLIGSLLSRKLTR